MESPVRRCRTRIICSRLESLPTCILIGGILHRLDILVLCTVACVSSKLRSFVSETLTDLPSIQITEFSPDTESIGKILRRCQGLNTLSIDCLRLSDGGRSIIPGLGPNLEEFKLLRASSVDSLVLQTIGEKCPNLSLLVLEVRECCAEFTNQLREILKCCIKLKCFCVRSGIKTSRHVPLASLPIHEYANFLPDTLNYLTLEPLTSRQAVNLVCNRPRSSNLNPVTSFPKLKRLCLVLDVITDQVLVSITSSIPHLSELSLQDDARFEMSGQARDLTNEGLASLGKCFQLEELSLVRKFSQFGSVDDEGIKHVSFCLGLQSVRLVGFRGVSNGGYFSILSKCVKLKKFVVKNADMKGASFCYLLGLRALKEVVVNRSRISEHLIDWSTGRYKNIESLCLRSCPSVLTENWIGYILSLVKLTSLDLSGVSVSDSGLAGLYNCTLPITSLRLKRCNLSSKGVMLMRGRGGSGTIFKTLTSLDLSSNPEIDDGAVIAIAEGMDSLTELSIRFCTRLTDSCIKALAMKGRVGRPIRKLDVRGCELITEAAVQYFKRPYFGGLYWIGVWGTCLVVRLEEIREGRPCLMVCINGCTIGCYKKWNSALHEVP